MSILGDPFRIAVRSIRAFAGPKGLAGEKKRGGAGRNVVNADKIKSGPKKARR